MNEEELFCKLFPEYAVNGKPLSPYFDLFESGYEQSEKRIAELKKKNLDTQDAVTMQMYTNKANKEIADRQLTKAKVALRNVIDYLGQFCSDYPDCVIEAEQFLSEVEK